MVARALAGLITVAWLAAFDVTWVEAASREARAEALYQRAARRFSHASVDSQSAALRDFEEAARLAPDRKDVWKAYGMACLETGRIQLSRACLTRLVRMGANDYESWFALGVSWKQDWLLTVERSSLDKATDCFERATRAAPDRAEGWTALASIALLRGRPGEALIAASRGCQLDSKTAEPTLTAAAACYRLGAVAEADRLFGVARSRFHEKWMDSFRWEGTDPDLTTAANEAELDGLTRWTMARFLFRDGDVVRWDQRAELFVRYGPPAFIELDPVWAKLEIAFPRHAEIMYAPPPIETPFHIQVWHYPQLGINAVLWDRLLRYSYDYPYANDRVMDPVPDPALVDARADLVALDGGRGVFRAVPPGTEPLSLKAIVNRFPVGDGTRIVTHLSSPGLPTDSLWGSWAVADEQGHVVHRESGLLSISECDPAGERLIEFAAPVPPGRYRVDVAVRNGSRGRGVAHLGVTVSPPAEELAMSDLVMICGDPSTSVGDNGIHLSPNVERHVDNPSSIAFYYELEGLGVGNDGLARFTYTCTLHPLERLGKEATMAAVYQASREEQNVGTHRRQFVTARVSSLEPGFYEARIRVKDLVTGAEVDRAVQFAKGWVPVTEPKPSAPSRLKYLAFW